MAYPKLMSQLWSVVLPLGRPKQRAWTFMQRWRIGPTSRQYCSLAGNRSVFQQTLHIADSVSGPERKLAIVDKQHYRTALVQLGECRANELVTEPVYRDTVASVFLGLSRVRAHNPDATVVLLPCDYFVYPEERLVKAVNAARRAVDLLNNQVVVLAVPPERRLPQHGLIQTGVELGWIADYRLCTVAAFSETPASKGAGMLWNTAILVAKAGTLWEMGCRSFPEVVQLLQKYDAAIATNREQTVLEKIYSAMPCRNFVTDLLRISPQRATVMELGGVLWCDWIRFKRIVATVGHIKKPSCKVSWPVFLSPSNVTR